MIVDPSPFRGDANGMHRPHRSDIGGRSAEISVEEPVEVSGALSDNKGAADERNHEVNGRGQTRAEVESMLQVILTAGLTQST